MQKVLNVIMVISLAFSLLICFYKVTGNESLTQLTAEVSGGQVKAISGGEGVRPQLANVSTNANSIQKQQNNRIGI
ncbi:hypothetical protein IC229_21265 [Spirosoma sp. BT702]|uniref:Uncharacterized protein n=1 Tax=Spirosoma profusum TaxID=2771354 RepID=A0A926XYB7_9BACT|nr:hypothetical protein [Spirosoma profusum]MBD2703189.1 hypothetical protein [Spirosoma profusum]